MNKQFDTVIVGLGKTGFSCARFLAAKGVDFAITDSREQPPMLSDLQKSLPHTPLYLGGFDPKLLEKTKRLLVSPGVSLRDEAIVNAVSSGVEVYGDVELFCRHISSPVIAVTGSNGKSTVVSMVTQMVRAAGLNAFAGANLGPPILDLLTEPEPDLYVLELSSFQLETVSSMNATAAVVLNLSPDHMDRYPDLRAYKAAKMRIYDGDGTMVINHDDPALANMQGAGRKILNFTLNEPDPSGYGVRVYDGVPWLVQGTARLMPINELGMKGKHNVANALAAMALASVIHCPTEIMLGVLRTFAGLEHRCQWVSAYKSMDWYNDSKATNVAATCAAITGLAGDGNLLLIAGGDGKGADFSSLADTAQGKLKAAIVLGQDGKKIGKVLKQVVPVYSVGNLKAAVAMAASLGQADDIVLLSPACASLDMFQDYQARGNAFIAAVKSLESS